MSDATSDDILSILQSWKGLMRKLKNPNSPDGAYELRPMNSELTSVFQEEVLPIFAGDDITDHISACEEKHPWLLDFKDPDGKGFPKALRHLQQDPIDISSILTAYITLHDFVRIKRGLTSSIRARLGLSEMSTRKDEDFALKVKTSISMKNKMDEEGGGEIQTPIISNNDKDDEKEDEIQDLNTTISREENAQLFKNSLESDERLFILTCGFCDIKGIYDTFRDLQYPQGRKPTNSSHSNWKGFGNPVKKIFESTKIVPPAGGADHFDSYEEWPRCIERLREKTTALSLSSNSRGMEMEKTVEDLRRKNSDQEKEIKKYRKIVSDLSFRHLMEMLPIAAQAAKEAARATSRHAAYGTVQSADLDENSDEEVPGSKKGRRGKKPGKNLAASSPQKRQKALPQNEYSHVPQWQDFWNDAWSKAGKEKPGPLNDLWERFKDQKHKDIRRGQIRDEGDKIFGRLSANIHDFGICMMLTSNKT